MAAIGTLSHIKNGMGGGGKERTINTHLGRERFIPLQNHVILQSCKSKSIAEVCLHGWILSYKKKKYIMEKGENAGYQHFLLFPQCFQMLLFSNRVLKSRDCLVKINTKLCKYTKT